MTIVDYEGMLVWSLCWLLIEIRARNTKLRKVFPLQTNYSRECFRVKVIDGRETYPSCKIITTKIGQITKLRTSVAKQFSGDSYLV